MTIVEDWTNALLSGEYEQGNNMMRNQDNEFCCLGVLCDLVKDEVYGIWERQGDYSFVFKTDGEERSGLPTDKATRYFVRSTGLSSSRVEDTFRVLAGYNDAGFSFAEIAKIVKDFVDHYFDLTYVVNYERDLNYLKEWSS